MFNGPPAPHARSLPYAAMVAGAYLVAAAAWIVGSGRVAAMLAYDAASLAEIERWKGLGFVVVTTTLLFAFSLALFRRLERGLARVDEARDALVAADRRALAGVLASSVAHDLNNYVTALMGFSELLLADPSVAQGNRERVQRMGTAIDGLAGLVRRLREASGQAGAREAQDVDLRRVAGDTIDLLRSHPRLRRCRVRLVADPVPVVVHAEPVCLHTALANLLLNASDATAGQGTVEVRVARSDAFATLEVHDDGPGVPADHRKTVFDAFYTTKADGTGLGLLSVQACARSNGGVAEVGDSPMGGACFRVVLPLPRASVADGALAAPQMAGPPITRAP